MGKKNSRSQVSQVDIYVPFKGLITYRHHGLDTALFNQSSKPFFSPEGEHDLLQGCLKISFSDPPFPREKIEGC